MSDHAKQRAGLAFALQGHKHGRLLDSCSGMAAAMDGKRVFKLNSSQLSLYGFLLRETHTHTHTHTQPIDDSVREGGWIRTSNGQA